MNKDDELVKAAGCCCCDCEGLKLVGCNYWRIFQIAMITLFVFLSAALALGYWFGQNAGGLN